MIEILTVFLPALTAFLAGCVITGVLTGRRHDREVDARVDEQVETRTREMTEQVRERTVAYGELTTRVRSALLRVTTRVRERITAYEKLCAQVTRMTETFAQKQDQIAGALAEREAQIERLRGTLEDVQTATNGGPTGEFLLGDDTDDGQESWLVNAELPEDAHEATAFVDRMLELEETRMQVLIAKHQGLESRTEQSDSGAVEPLEAEIEAIRGRVRSLCESQARKLAGVQAVCRSLEQRCAELDREREHFALQVAELEEANASAGVVLAAERADAEEALASLQTRCNEIERDRDASLAELNEKLAAAEPFEARCAEQSAQLTELEAARQQLESALNELEATHAGALAEHQDERASAAEELASLQQRCTEIERDRDASLAELNERLAAAEPFEARCAEQSAELTELQGVRQQLESALSELEATHAGALVEHEAERASAAEELASLQQRCTEIERDRDASLAELNERLAAAEPFEALYTEQSQALAELDGVRQQLERQLAELETTHATALTEREAERANAQRELEALQTECSEIRRDRDESMAELAVQLAAAASFEARCAEQSQELAAVDEARQQLERQVTELEAAHASAVAEHEADRAGSNQRIEELGAQCTDLARDRDERIAALNDVVSEAQQALSATQAELDDTRSTASEQARRVAELEGLRAELEHRVEEARAELAHQESQIQVLLDEAESREGVLQSRDQSLNHAKDMISDLATMVESLQGELT